MDKQFLNNEDYYLSEIIRCSIIDKASSEYGHKNNISLDNIIRTNIKIKIDDIISPELVMEAIKKIDNNTNFSSLEAYAHSFTSTERRYKKILYEQYGDITLTCDEKNNSIELIIYFKINIEDHEFKEEDLNPIENDINI